jgi:lysophospholipase L1-like esterase
MDLFREVMFQAKKEVDGWGGQLYFVYLPEWARYSGYRSWGKTQRDSVLKIVKNLEIPTVDIVPAFQKSSDPLSLFPFRETGHYNEAGHQLVGEEVLKSIPRIPGMSRRPPEPLS